MMSPAVKAVRLLAPVISVGVFSQPAICSRGMKYSHSCGTRSKDGSTNILSCLGGKTVNMRFENKLKDASADIGTPGHF
jgi:hypothetical protein